ncbi:MAG: GH3 auxin-responsive promoter family protein [Leptolyngbya sp. SIO4C1]|nr:GH3 auxin-responsive promoter family protein [Leptolyngbya sp. SIO4C1]
MTHPLMALVSAAARWQQRAFVRQLSQAESVQAAFLQQLLRLHQGTVLGRELQLAKMTTVSQFRQQVPIWPYSGYVPYFDRTAAGEPNVVTPEPVLHFNLSSGSTGSQKLIPITARSQRKRTYANQVAMGFAFARSRQLNLSLGKLLVTTCAQPIGYTSGGRPYGHVSGNQLRTSNSPFYRHLFAQPFEALMVHDSVARNYLCLLFALRDRHLSVIAANFPLIALQLCRYLDQYAASLIDDIGSGEIADWIKLDPALRARLARQFKADPQRAEALQQLYQTAGTLLPKQAWPNLAFVITARGGPSDFYFERFSDYFGDIPIFGGTYAASEAVFGSHWNFNTDGTLLAIKTNFFEFVPADQWEIARPKTLLPHEVRVGELYRVLVTNYSGFYRYDIGDVVEVVGFRQQVPLITFRYRRGGTLSAITEKTTEHHVVYAMSALRHKYALPIEDFCVTLSPDVVAPYYVLNLELPPNSSLTQPENLLADFDDNLQTANASYALKRRSGDILAPQLNRLSPGSFKQLRQQRLRPGQFDDAEIKLPHISGDRALLEAVEILQTVRLRSA